MSKNSISPAEITEGSKLKIWWLCESGHSWIAIVNNRKKSGCPVCSKRLTVAGTNDIASTSPKLAMEFDSSKNSQALETVVDNQNALVWWKCDLGHSWRQAPRIRSRGAGCPFCSNQRVLPGFNDLQTKYPEVALWWDETKNGLLKPTGVMPGSNVKVDWLCNVGHEFSDSVTRRVAAKGCPICLNRRLLVGFNDLMSRRPDLAAEWNYERNSVSPAEVIYSTKSRYWWLCDIGHSWQIDPQSRSTGSGCPTCSKTGFKPEEPGRMYFLKNSDLQARKVGITNTSSRISRIDQFKRRGWEEIFSLDDPSGAVIQLTERNVIVWLRQELGLGQALSPQVLSGMSGHTETFSAEQISDSEVIDYIKSAHLEARYRHVHANELKSQG
jgi:hypothetical protein